MISIFPGSNEKKTNKRLGQHVCRVILARDPAGRLMFFSFKLLNPGLMKHPKKTGQNCFLRMIRLRNRNQKGSVLQQ